MVFVEKKWCVDRATDRSFLMTGFRQNVKYPLSLYVLMLVGILHTLKKQN